MEMKEGTECQEVTHFRHAPKNNLNTVYDWPSSKDVQIGVKKVSECDNERVGHFFLSLTLLMNTAAGPQMKLARAIVLVVGGAPIFFISEPR